MPFIASVTLLCGLCLSLSAEARTLKFCIIDEDYDPFSFVGRDAPAQKRIRTAVANKGDHVEFIPVPWKRCTEGVKTRTYDGIVGAVANPSFIEHMDFPQAKGKIDPKQSLGPVEFMVIRRRESKTNWRNEKFEHLTQPVLHGAGVIIVRDKLAQLKIQANDTAKTPLQLIEMVDKKRTEIAIIRRAEAAAILKLPKFAANLEMLPEPFASQPAYLAVQKNLGATDKAYFEALWLEISALRP